MELYFTSDLHFGHKNIIDYCKRPFSDVNEMNQFIIDEWNKKVTDMDVVYLLGDISFASVNKTIELHNQLNGTIHLIVGNHDKHLLKSDKFKSRFANVCNYHEFEHNGITICLSHYPMTNWYNQRKGGWMLHGHTHGTMKHVVTAGNKIMDVGYDTGHFLYSYADIEDCFQKEIQ